jgi:hypothetical protein
MRPQEPNLVVRAWILLLLFIVIVDGAVLSP